MLKQAVTTFYIQTMFKPKSDEIITLEPMISDLIEYMEKRAKSDLDFLKICANFYTTNTFVKYVSIKDCTQLSIYLHRAIEKHINSLSLDELATFAFALTRWESKSTTDPNVSELLKRVEHLIFSQ